MYDRGSASAGPPTKVSGPEGNNATTSDANCNAHSLTPFIQRNFRGLVLRQTDGPHELRCLKEVETAVAGANLRTPGEVQVAAGNSDASRRGARSRSTARLEEPRVVPGEVEGTSPEKNLRFKDGGLGRDKQPRLRF